MVTVLTDRGEHEVATTGGLRLSAADAEKISGWTLKPEGMCRDELCVPLAGDARVGGQVDLAAFWSLLGNPVVATATGDAWVLGTAAETRANALAGLQAPDFTLPDLAGVSHSLSELRGKKVFLTTWASW